MEAKAYETFFFCLMDMKEMIFTQETELQYYFKKVNLLN